MRDQISLKYILLQALHENDSVREIYLFVASYYCETFMQNEIIKRLVTDIVNRRRGINVAIYLDVFTTNYPQGC